jgi:hypothetical protein
MQWLQQCSLAVMVMQPSPIFDGSTFADAMVAGCFGF